MQFLPLIMLMLIASTTAIIIDRRREARQQIQTAASPATPPKNRPPPEALPAATASFRERLAQVWRSRMASHQPAGSQENQSESAGNPT